MAAFASRYARAFADVVASAHLDTAAIDRQLERFSRHVERQQGTPRRLREPGHSRSAEGGDSRHDERKLGLQRELRNLIAVLINNDRIAHMHEVADAYRAEMQERLGIRQAEIVTARQLERTGARFAAGRRRQAGRRSSSGNLQAR